MSSEHPRTISAYRMLEFFDLLVKWSESSFGPSSHRGPVGPLKHLQKEAQEAIDEAVKTTDLLPGWNMDKLREEITDCLFLVFDAAWRAGITYGELAMLARRKLDVNKLRTWPDWRTLAPDAISEHVKEEEHGPTCFCVKCLPIPRNQPTADAPDFEPGCKE